MSDLPILVPVATAALIAGRSPAKIRQLIAARKLAVLFRLKGRVFVVLDSLGRFLGRKITPAEYLAAERRRDARRAYQANYRRRNKGAD
jgi:hypothetical protein